MVIFVRFLDIVVIGFLLVDDLEMLFGLINVGNVEVYSLDEEEIVIDLF